MVDGFDRTRISGRRREVLTRYEPMTRVDRTGTHDIVREWTFEYLVLDECAVPFTGALEISYPYGDPWETPSAGVEDIEKQRAVVLEFVDGKLIG